LAEKKNRRIFVVDLNGCAKDGSTAFFVRLILRYSLISGCKDRHFEDNYIHFAC